jgi:hypothetical protein
MDENPYKSPVSVGKPPAEPMSGTFHPLTWALIGFAGGTGLTAPFILSIDLPTRIVGGMLHGGIIGAICGLRHGIRRRKATS